MKIYHRDYSVLTSEEVAEWETLKEQEKSIPLGGNWIVKSLNGSYPKAVRHFMSLFPNNHLDTVDLRDGETLAKLSSAFLNELNKPHVNEADVLKFIKESGAYPIIASILKAHYSFGHHDAFIIPEFELGNSYRVDYLLVGRSSGGYEFTFVELEHPTKDITTKDGELGSAFRKGIKQVRDWKQYLESSYPSLRETFEKYRHPDKQLPDEFTLYDSSRMHFVVIAGRRTNFKSGTYRIGRERAHEVKLLHYDNLYDYAVDLVGQLTY